MSVALAVLLCRLFVTCSGVPAGILISKGVCSTVARVPRVAAPPSRSGSQRLH